MPDDINPRFVRASVKIYERLLAAYPAPFRREYGQSMKQLFRDQCRDAWSESGRRGLMLLWLRVLADWAKTSIVEHLSSVNQKTLQFMKTLRALIADPRLRASFFRVFAEVFILAIVCSFLITIWSPRVYSSTARIEVQNPDYSHPLSSSAYSLKDAPDPYFILAQLKIIESYHVLTNVITDLKLAKILPEQLGEPRWTIDETYQHLIKMIDVKRTRATCLIEVSVKNPDPALAAAIVNKIAFFYKEVRLTQWMQWRDDQPDPKPEALAVGLVIVRDPGRAEFHPISPNRRTLLMWTLAGTLLALIAGGLAARFRMISRAFRPSRGQAGG